MYTKTFLLSAVAALSYALPAAEPQGEGFVAPESAGVPIRPDWVTIENVTFAGTGCPTGSVKSQITTDKQTINLGFDEYYASHFEGSKPKDETKNCNVNLKVRFPPGFTLAIANTDVRGFAMLDKGCTATIGGRSWWSGQQKDASIQSSIKGEFIGEYIKTMTVPTAALVWSNCGAEGLLNVDTRLLAQCKKEDQEAYIQIDAQDSKLTTELQWNLGLKWRRC